ncbi:hypothetical protein [Halorussus halobius]|uniref:hypothetical protein n=1 Tax=Halorussus halobius TaxID=1710537 RepID=UPI0010926CE4|nr:hypothetical protein [Halorussus halobius]
MRRREALYRTGVLAATGGLAALAGCSGGGDADTERTTSASLSREGFDYREGEDGNLVVTVTMTNSGSSEGTGYLYVTATAATPTASEATSDEETVDETDAPVDGDGDGRVASRKSREVSVPAGETLTVEVPFEITYEQFTRAGGIDVDLRT